MVMCLLISGLLVARSRRNIGTTIVGKNDRTVHPDVERFVAKRMGAKVTEVASSHVPMLSHPDVVIDVIRAAAKAVQKATAAA
jgi:pimeloyl-ACP methyl ester carboxylesterase